MKQFILMKALTESEWDPTEFALLPFLPKQFRAFLKKRELLSTLDGIDELVVYSNEVEFYIDSSELPERIEFDSIEEFEEGPGFMVELSEDDISQLGKPEQIITHGRIHFTKYEVKFVAFGKHTDEEYWCRVNWKTIESILATHQIEKVSA